MRLLEYESKAILKNYGIQTPSGLLISPSDSFGIQYPVVLKPQIPIGGRGKAGAILDASTEREAGPKIAALFATEISGYTAKKILIEEKLTITREYFMAVTYDTVAKTPLAVFSRVGGVDLEARVSREPDKVSSAPFSLRSRLPAYRARDIISETGISGKQLVGLGQILAKLVDVFIDCDATLAEINPLALVNDGRFVALDCHLEIDDDAFFRQPDLAQLCHDEGRFGAARQKTAFERQAAAVDQLDHRGVAGRVIEFDGTLGLIIGGGGASLTCFDAVRSHGGKPANYCEIGGNPSVRKVKALTRLILSKPGVAKIAVIMNVVSNTRVDLVARGIIKGILESGKVPAETVAVFRVPGAWEEEGFKILSRYGVPYCDRSVSIDEAARLAVKDSN